jgi:hypothetical protein
VVEGGTGLHLLSCQFWLSVKDELAQFVQYQSTADREQFYAGCQTWQLQKNLVAPLEKKI